MNHAFAASGGRGSMDSIVQDEPNLELSRVVAILADRRAKELARLEALIIFLNWLWWPTEGQRRPLANLSCVARYVQDHPTNPQLPGEDVEAWFRRWATPQLVIRAFLKIDLYWPDYRPTAKAEFDYVSDVVRFMLSYQRTDTKDKRKAASLNKAQLFLVERGGFAPSPSKQAPSQSVSDRLWVSLRNACHFYFVNRHFLGGSFLLSPEEPRYSEALDGLLAGDHVERFLGMSKWVQYELMRVLDKRALAQIEFPQIPDHIQEIPVEVPKFPDWALAQMADF